MLKQNEMQLKLKKDREKKEKEKDTAEAKEVLIYKFNWLELLSISYYNFYVYKISV